MADNQSTSRRPEVAGVILAGGTGERLGGTIKANLVIANQRLLERVVAALGPSVSPLLVAHGRLDPSALRLPAGMVPVPDAAAGPRGPLAGLCAGVTWLSAQRTRPDFLVSAAVDTPDFPSDFVIRALETIEAGDAVIARHGAQAYPTDALWKFDAIRALARWTSGPRAPHSLKGLAASLDCRFLDWPADGPNPFVNINTSADLVAHHGRII